mmetsp:Transcript_8386/g.34035  ORF Transcript_8386/g.34035 Transcript_8386/m.34035 type:complete len:236 (+) Transcript_8386:850-1557(+)
MPLKCSSRGPSGRVTWASPSPACSCPVAATAEPRTGGRGRRSTRRRGWRPPRPSWAAPRRRACSPSAAAARCAFSPTSRRTATPPLPPSRPRRRSRSPTRTARPPPRRPTAPIAAPCHRPRRASSATSPPPATTCTWPSSRTAPWCATPICATPSCGAGPRAVPRRRCRRRRRTPARRCGTRGRSGWRGSWRASRAPCARAGSACRRSASREAPPTPFNSGRSARTCVPTGRARR